MIAPCDLALRLQRITWRDGQALLARDLRDDEHYSDALRHLHIRYLHATWGVVDGLDVLAAGPGAVLVLPGYAVDREGRELLRPRALRLAVPVYAAATTMYLVLLRSNIAGACDVRRNVASSCAGTRDAAWIEQGDLAWKSVSEVWPGADILLARVLIAGGRLASPIDTSVRRRAQSFKRPRFWSDTTQQGQTGWTPAPGGEIAEIVATVDTTEAGFIETPAYFARLVGAPAGTSGFIGSAGPTQFTFIVRTGLSATLAPFNPAGPVFSNAFQTATITWYAVELPARGLLQ